MDGAANHRTPNQRTMQRITSDQLNIEVMRQYSGDDCTSGSMGVNGQFLCHTLERPWADNQKNISSIPAGTYPAFLRYDKADHWRLQLENVPGRTGVQIHVGNEPDQTLGCILVGMDLAPSKCSVSRSKDAYAALKRAFYGTEFPTATPDSRLFVTISDP